MHCKNCRSKLNDKDVFCSNCGTKVDILNNLENDANLSKNNIKSIDSNFNVKKNHNILNIICKVLLIFNFILIAVRLMDGKGFLFFPSVMLIVTTIVILKTQQKKTNIFLIMGIIAICLPILFHFMTLFTSTFGILLAKLLGADVNFSDFVRVTQESNSLFIKTSFIVVLIVVGILFIIIHKKQKFKNK